jgi:hypothetical protein
VTFGERRRQIPEPAPTCVFRLLDLGLVVIENERQDERCSVYRPVGLAGTLFPGWEKGLNISERGAYMRVSAPPADLYPVGKGVGKRWVVDISVFAAPGPGPIYFHEEFEKAEDAVTAIKECFFGNRVDFASELLGPWRQRKSAEQSVTPDRPRE